MDNKESIIIQYRDCIINADVQIISENENKIAYNGFTNYIAFKKSIKDLEGRALLALDKDSQNHHQLNVPALINYSNIFLNEKRQYNDIIVNPFLLKIDENKKIDDNQDFTKHVLTKIAEFSKIQYDSVYIFNSTLKLAVQDKPELSPTKNHPIIKNTFSKIDIIELTTLLHEADVLQFNENDFSKVVSNIASMFGIGKIKNAKIQKGQLRERRLTFMLLDKLKKAEEDLENDFLW